MKSLIYVQLRWIAPYICHHGNDGLEVSLQSSGVMAPILFWMGAMTKTTTVCDTFLSLFFCTLSWGKLNCKKSFSLFLRLSFRLSLREVHQIWDIPQPKLALLMSARYLWLLNFWFSWAYTSLLGRALTLANIVIFVNLTKSLLPSGTTIIKK